MKKIMFLLCLALAMAVANGQQPGKGKLPITDPNKAQKSKGTLPVTGTSKPVSTKGKLPETPPQNSSKQTSLDNTKGIEMENYDPGCTDEIPESGVLYGFSCYHFLDLTLHHPSFQTHAVGAQLISNGYVILNPLDDVLGTEHDAYAWYDQLTGITATEYEGMGNMGKSVLVDKKSRPEVYADGFLYVPCNTLNDDLSMYVEAPKNGKTNGYIVWFQRHEGDRSLSSTFLKKTIVFTDKNEYDVPQSESKDVVAGVFVEMLNTDNTNGAIRGVMRKKNGKWVLVKVKDYDDYVVLPRSAQTGYSHKGNSTSGRYDQKDNKP